MYTNKQTNWMKDFSCLLPKHCMKETCFVDEERHRTELWVYVDLNRLALLQFSYPAGGSVLSYVQLYVM